MGKYSAWGRWLDWGVYDSPTRESIVYSTRQDKQMEDGVALISKNAKNVDRIGTFKELDAKIKMTTISYYSPTN